MSAALRETFNEVAELYDRARPDYPEAVFDGITELTGLCAGSRVLEIGGGTGQATASIAECGCAVTAVELGASMAEIVRRNLARFPKVTVINSSFEEWVLPEEPFDLVVAATAFHWIDPTMRLPKVAAALGQGGCFALIDTVHINEELEDSPYFAAPILRRFERAITYSKADYIDLLRTYSGSRHLPEQLREGLFD